MPSPRWTLSVKGAFEFAPMTWNSVLICYTSGGFGHRCAPPGLLSELLRELLVA
jgi:hypothetical protein